MKTKVVHSQSKLAWNIIGQELGGKYKIARIPYQQCDREILNTKLKHEALEIALHLSRSMTTFNTDKKVEDTRICTDNEWWKGNGTITVPNGTGDLVPYHTICGCTTCGCIMPNKMVRKGDSTITSTSTGTDYIIDPVNAFNTNEK